jgi:hypothetical protein
MAYVKTVLSHTMTTEDTVLNVTGKFPVTTFLSFHHFDPEKISLLLTLSPPSLFIGENMHQCVN